MASQISSRRVLTVSFLVDVFDVLSNLIVSIYTGSAVVFSEMAQGLADSSGSALLVIGERRAKRPEDAEHPMGYTREAFFWGLLSAVVMLVVGAGLSAWQGYRQLVDPEPLETPILAVAVVALAVVTNSYAVSLSLRKLSMEAGGLRAAFRNMEEPLVKSALLRDVIGTFTSIVGLAALLLYQWLDMLVFDALGALVAAAMMVVASLVLIGQARALISGQALPPGALERLRATIVNTPGVVALNGLSAIYSGTSQVVVDADLDLDEDLDTVQIESLLDLLEERVRRVMPDTAKFRVALNSPALVRRPATRR